jgi:hypothetical protein
MKFGGPAGSTFSDQAEKRLTNKKHKKNWWFMAFYYL